MSFSLFSGNLLFYFYVYFLFCELFYALSFFKKIYLKIEIQREEIKSCEERVKKLLEVTPPRGKDFLQKIEHILERENNWVRIVFTLAYHLLVFCHNHFSA